MLAVVVWDRRFALCYRNFEDDLEIISEYDRIREVFRTRLIDRSSRYDTVLSEYITLEWSHMEFVHRQSIFDAWILRFCALYTWDSETGELTRADQVPTQPHVLLSLLNRVFLRLLPK
jgi:hypothetical protein